MRRRPREEAKNVRKITHTMVGVILKNGFTDSNFLKLREEAGLVSKDRKCLRCDNSFHSQSRSNRICNHCAQNPLIVCTRHGDYSMAVKFGQLT